ncbi:hypothetical protein ACLMJK_005151 [Lecanora helva]
MPSLNRPNAPNRLPSADFGDLFIKPREPKGFEAKGLLTTPSPLSTPVHAAAYRRALRSSEGGKLYSQSPLASPAVSVPQRRPQHAERLGDWSESNTDPSIYRGSSRHSPYASEVIEEEPTPLATRLPSSTATKVTDTRDYSLSTINDHAPREARSGFQWTRDFLGGWLEIRIGKQKGLDEEETYENLTSDIDAPGLISSSASSLHLPITRTTTTATTTATGDTAGHIGGQPPLPETPDSFDSLSTLGPLKEGLYCRTKRALGLKHGPITPYVQNRSRTPTGAILDRVTSTLRFVPEKASTTSTSAATSVTNLSIAAPRTRRQRPGRRNGWSASSSVRDLMMGKPPIGTPEPEVMYTGSDSHQYLSVDLSQPDAPAFLPSEARRINTPPLPSRGSGLNRPQGFFFDYRPPAEATEDFFPKRPLPPGTGNSAKPRIEPDWYRVKLNAIESAPDALEDDLPSNLPEHLPSSPLCPKNPKHKSGGKGICPFHGRNKSIPSDTESTRTLDRSGPQSPVPENWWMK